MNEQDFMNKIDENTKNLQIPESITPDNIKKMLDETLQTQPDQSHNENGTGKRNRHIRRLTAAACVVLVIAGGIGISQINRNGALSDTTSGSNQAYNDTADIAAESADDTGNDNSDFGKDLAYQTKFRTPDSYEDYFNTVKSAYDAYYDRISTVETNDIMLEESATGAADESMVDSVAENAVMEYAKEFSLDSATAGTGSADRSVSNGSVTASKNKETTGNPDTSNDEYSKTNTQEKNIDEGDIIKTDGTYIYRVTNNYDQALGDNIYSLVITKTDNGKLTPVTAINLIDLKPENDSAYFAFHEFYLYDDQLVILYSVEDYSGGSSGNMSYIAVYNVKHKDKPTLTKKLSQSGWYESSRISNGYLYTITNYDCGNFTDIKRYKDYVPTVDDNTIPCENIYYTDDVLMDTSHVVTSLNLSNPTEFSDSKSIPVNGSSVYVSDNAIYFYASLYDEITKTEIMKMYYDKGKLTVGNSAVIAGSLYGPFAINEYDGHLRIVATIPANNVSLLWRGGIEDLKEASDESDSTVREDVNALYILDDNLNLTGKLTGIAPGERIYSARFMGNTGYFVTYKNTDPLFSVDLSDPANPTILGTLKIPGFSNYLHPYGDGILLGFGEETDPETQEFLGLKLSMFDISDPANVKEEDKCIIEDAMFSDAQYDYRSMMIDPEKNIFGFLYYADTKQDGYYSGNGKYYYVTYAYDEEYGFIETAKYVIDDGSEYESNGVRGVYIGDYLYICTNRQITSYKLNSEEKIDRVVFKK